MYLYMCVYGFSDCSVGKESACNEGDLGLIPGLGRSPGEGIDYPPQYSWVSLVAQLVKNLPAMQETWGPSLGWEDLLEKRTATHSSILACRIPWTISWDRKEPAFRVPRKKVSLVPNFVWIYRLSWPS